MAQRDASSRWARAGSIAALIGFLLAAYGSTLSVPFLGDDYVFLDETRSASFVQLWSRAHTAFDWWRPWSREFHFWLVQRLAGAREAPFHVVNLLLWLAAMLLYARLATRLADRHVAWIATCGVASLALWGGPLVWISGCQDLWMLVLALTTMVGFTGGASLWPVVAYTGALLSKETAAVLPVVLFVWALGQAGLSPIQALRRLAPMLVVTALWFFVNPCIGPRLGFGSSPPASGEDPLSAPQVLLHSLASLVNLSTTFTGFDAQAFRPVETLASVAALALALWLAMRPLPASEQKAIAERRARAAAFGLEWAIVGWLPLYSKTIRWHAYYGGLGTLGAWLFIATWLAGRRRLAIAIVAVLALVRGVDAACPSWDWGSEWYQRRAGNLLSLVRSQLLAQHPTVAPHTRFYFGSVPNNIGLVAGESPAVRVWYGDSTLRAGFYSYFGPRAAGEPGGADLFFHFDSTYGLREVHLGPEDLPRAMHEHPGWERDHESVAAVLLNHGDPHRAAIEYEKIGALPKRADALLAAAALWRRLGSTAHADTLIGDARRRLALGDADVARWLARLDAELDAAGR